MSQQPSQVGATLQVRHAAWDELLFNVMARVGDFSPLAYGARLQARVAPFASITPAPTNGYHSMSIVRACSQQDWRACVEAWTGRAKQLVHDEDLARRLHTQAMGGGPGLVHWAPTMLATWFQRLLGCGTMARLSRCLSRGICPTCAYPLGCPFEHPEGGAVFNIPVICPECGAAWPLLPPRL
jgi:hypothetical protein